MLSQDQAIMFVGFIKSANLLGDRLWTSAAERAGGEGVSSKEYHGQILAGAGIKDSTHVDLPQHQRQEHSNPSNLPTLASEHKITEAAADDPNLTWQSSARSKTQPTLWYCHSCNSGPYNFKIFKAQHALQHRPGSDLASNQQKNGRLRVTQHKLCSKSL
ncbi:hypothetical protein N7G274_003298 [Stereocaulon virgatum]|uniref:Uncharacterized protein n=1 Tax=Stereocaulon virgatum TaxID=373712 RepID=A0ABR4AEA0_9LECA